MSDESDGNDDAGPCSKEFNMTKKMKKQKIHLDAVPLDLEATGKYNFVLHIFHI